MMAEQRNINTYINQSSLAMPTEEKDSGIGTLSSKSTVTKKSQPSLAMPTEEKDSGIGTLGSKSTVTKKFQRKRGHNVAITFAGSLPEETEEDAKDKKNSYDPSFLKQQRLQLAGLGLKVKEKRKDRIKQWLMNTAAINQERQQRMSVLHKSGWTIDDSKMTEIDLASEKLPSTNMFQGRIDRLMIGDFKPSREALDIFALLLEATQLEVYELDFSNCAPILANSIAELLKLSRAKSLAMRNCELNEWNIFSIKRLLGGVQLDKLDISDNSGIGSVGYGHVGDLVRLSRISTLVLNKCMLSRDEIGALNLSVGDMKIHQLDLSGNTLNDAAAIRQLGEMAQRCETKSLVLKDCKLNSETILLLKKSLQNVTLENIDVSENPALDAVGMKVLGHLVRQCEVHSLALRDCLLTPEHMAKLKQSLGNFKLTEFDISRKKQPAQALSGVGSKSTVSSASSSQSDETEFSDVVSPGSQATSSIHEKFAQTAPHQPYECLSALVQDFVQATYPVKQTDFKPVKLIQHIVSNVTKHIKMENWNIDDTGQQLLRNEMTERKLNNLRITFGTNKTPITANMGMPENSQSSKTFGTEKKILWNLPVGSPCKPVDDESTSKIKPPAQKIHPRERIRRDAFKQESGLSYSPPSSLMHSIKFADETSEEEVMTTSGCSDNQEQIQNSPRFKDGLEEEPTHRTKQKECKQFLVDNTIQKEIGAEGGELKVCGCRLKFPPGALTQKTPIKISVSSDSEDISADFLAVTPLLRCEPSMTFRKPVAVEMPTCFWPVRNVPITILFQKKGKPWQPLPEKAVSYNTTSLRFHISHFCKEVGGMNKSDSTSVKFHLCNQVYFRNKGLLASVFCKYFNDELQKETEDIMRRAKYSPLPMPPEELIVKVGDEINMRLSCSKPESANVSPQNCSLELISDFFRMNRYQKYFKIGPKPHGNVDDVEMSYFLSSTGKQEQEVPLFFSWPLEVGTEGAESRSHNSGEAARSTAVNLSFEVVGEKHTVANTAASGGSKITGSYKDSHLTASQSTQGPNTPGTSGTSHASHAPERRQVSRRLTEKSQPKSGNRKWK